jgi:hypothetical protein
VIDVRSLCESFELRCGLCRCGGADTFTDLPGVEAFMNRAAVPFGIRAIHAGDLERFGPVHVVCVNPPKRRPPAKKPPYDLTKSVA